MADWTGLAGAAGLAAALEEIQGRRLREAQLQRELTQGQGEWTPGAPGRGGVLGFFDALLGYNKPGEIGFGSQRYKFEPYPKMTEEDVRGLGLTMPQEVTIPGQPSTFAAFAPPGEQPRGFGATAAARAGQTPGMTFAPADLTAAPFARKPAQRVTREMPLPGFVGQRMDPVTRRALALERFKEQRDLTKLREEYRLASQGLGVEGGDTQAMRTTPFEIPGTAGTPAASTTGTAAPTTPEKPVAGAKRPLGTPTKEMEDAIAEAHQQHPTVRPELIRALMASESNFNAQAVSPKGAQGVMQIMPGTQKMLGLKDPFNVRDNTLAGTRYFAMLLKTYNGNEELALAAYNAGPGAVAAAGGKIPANKETQAFVPKVLSLATPGAFAQAPAPAPAPTQPAAPAAGGTGMQVAGPGAPAPPTARSTPDQDAAYRTSVGQPPPTATPSPSSPATSGTTTPAPSGAKAPAEVFVPSETLVTRVEYNKRQMAANDQRIQQLEAERRMAQVQARRNMPGAADRLRMYSEQQTDLRKQNKELFEDSQKAYNTEHGTWQDTQTKRGDEGRKPPLEADVKTAVQDAEISEPLRGTKAALVEKGQVPDKPWKEYGNKERAIVYHEHSQREKESAQIDKLNEWERSALFKIIKDEGTPIGRATPEQLTRAQGIGRKNEAEFAQKKKIMEGDAAYDTMMKREDALAYIDPVTLKPATRAMTPRQAEEGGLILMSKPQQDTARNAHGSIMYIDRLNTLYFGGIDKDGSITGQAGKNFEGIYPWVERTRKETQTLGSRISQTAAVRTGLLEGQTMAQWARVADRFISASLGAISRDMGGERGHFTDGDAIRTREYFSNFGSSWWGKTLGDPNLMKTSGEAKKMMGLVAGVISDRVRNALHIAPGDPLPWNTRGEYATLLPKPAPKGQSAPATGQTAPATGTPAAAEEPVPTPPAAQAPAPASTSQRPTAPAAAQPAQRLEQLTTQYPPAQYAGKKIKDPVTGKRYQSDGSAWQEMP